MEKERKARIKERVKNCVNKLKVDNNVDLIRRIIIAILFVKSVLFMTLLESKNVDKFNFEKTVWIFFIVYLAYSLLVYAFGYLFNGNKQMIYYIVMDIIFSGWLIINIWYFRGNFDFMSIKNIFYPETFNPMGEALVQFKWIDLIFILDIPILIFFIKYKKIQFTEKRNIRKFELIVVNSILVLMVCYIFTDVLGAAGWSNRMFTTQWTPLMTARASGPVGFQIHEGNKTLDSLKRKNTDSDEEVQAWLKNNVEDVKDNEYKGMFKGKNVVFLQLESLEEFVINKKVEGQEISPFLNKLANEGLYFNNIYEQNNAGNSIDCDVMANTSMYPMGSGITALHTGNFVYKNSMARILKEDGYTSISTRGEKAGEFYWSELHKNGFGIDHIWDVKDYVYEESVGYGLSDGSLFRQLADKLKDVKEPFYLNVITLSNHGPFKVPKKYQSLKLDKKINETYLGGYFQSVRYMDEQLEMFFGKLKQEGLLDNTVFVLYGDHGGVHKYYNKDIKDLDYEGNWWKPYTKKIPLIIYSPGVEPHVFKAAGGQVDIMPTILYMLGVEKDRFINNSMGRILVNTNRDATIIKGNKIKGKVQSEEEKEHLEKAYSIGEKMIGGN
ncbi:MAG: LTA synthase family protein [Clostridium sp.]|uniref:LTA synthase family protein n=1 Tax=Clostridium sp. TaxID=1506 RepID=UPI003F32FC43